MKGVSFIKAVRFVLYGIYSRMLNMTLPPIRVWMLRFAGARIGTNTVMFNIRFANLFHYGFRKLAIGNDCFIGDDVTLDVRGGICLEDKVTLSNGCTIVTHTNVGFSDHPLQRYYPTKESPVTIKYGSYIGTGAIILPGVTIGKESVVGAGAVVTRNVPDHVMVAGVPAKVKKKLMRLSK